ncbi:MAG: hypothetical protein FWH35_06315 [Treponema sp.]|nr:hypothetical protein [Treponema sp.]
MRNKIFILLYMISSLAVFAQVTVRIPTVGILPFETSGTGVNAGEAGEATRLVVSELASWGFMTILEGSQAESAEYIIKGQITRQNNQVILSAVTSESRTGRNLNNSTERGASLSAISIESFCTSLTENVPFPNYLAGKWQSTINMTDGPVTCIMEFLSNRTVKVEQYDTWEHDGTNSLKYQAIGEGSYSYAGYRRRTVNISGREILADATIGINLSLEDALPKYTAISRSGIRVLFDESKNSFELVNSGFPCGDNNGGASVYSSASVAYTRFTKIR